MHVGGHCQEGVADGRHKSQRKASISLMRDRHYVDGVHSPRPAISPCVYNGHYDTLKLLARVSARLGKVHAQQCAEQKIRYF